MEILISIHHKYAESIYAGTKTWELRKCRLNVQPGTKCYIYEPLPVGKVTGYFIFQGCVKSEKDFFWKLHGNDCGMTADDYFKYYQKKRYVYAWRIARAYEYVDPFTLQDMRYRAPLSFRYIQD